MAQGVLLINKDVRLLQSHATGKYSSSQSIPPSFKSETPDQRLLLLRIAFCMFLGNLTFLPPQKRIRKITHEAPPRRRHNANYGSHEVGTVALRSISLAKVLPAPGLNDVWSMHLRSYFVV